MKKLYSSLLCAALVQSYAFPAEQAKDMDSNEMRLDDLDKVKDPMDDSDDSKSDDLRDLTGKVEDEEDKAPEKSLDTQASEMSLLTENDVKNDAMLHQNMANKYNNLSNVLGGLSTKLEGYLPSGYLPSGYLSKGSSLTDSEREFIADINKVRDLCRNAAMAHGKARAIWDSLNELMNKGFEPSQKLQAIATELSRKATEISDQADKEMVSVLGLKPIAK